MITLRHKDMSIDFDRLLQEYDYSVPPEAIAQAPAQARDSAKLLVYDRTSGRVAIDIFRNLAHYLPSRAVLVLNDTKVLPARLHLVRENGGHIEILYVRTDGNEIIALASKKLPPATTLFHKSKQLFTVIAQAGKEYRLRPTFPIAEIFDVLEREGVMPLPPYIKHSPLSPLQQREAYQTVFAHYPGSIAAPTASLHFTPELLAQLLTQGFSLAYLTLHVNLGTFAPLTPQHLHEGKLHQEQFTITQRTATQLESARREGRPVIAVGTTAMRTLETASDRNHIAVGPGTTDIFIQPGYTFNATDGLITNFHVPRSSLLMLVSALVGREKLFELYALALKKKFRFFSFGDAMLIT